MHFYVTLTSNCNLKCRHCCGKSSEDFGSDFHGLTVDCSLPSSIAYDTEELQSFLEKDREPVIVFYGAEPLVQMDRLREIMDEVRVNRFLIQTNGLLLDKLEPEYVRL